MGSNDTWHHAAAHYQAGAIWGRSMFSRISTDPQQQKQYTAPASALRFPDALPVPSGSGSGSGSGLNDASRSAEDVGAAVRAVGGRQGSIEGVVSPSWVKFCWRRAIDVRYYRLAL